jgi:hypothetical protein
MARIPRYAWPAPLARFIEHELLPRAKARGIHGRLSVHDRRDGDRTEYVVTIRVPAMNLLLAETFVEGAERGRPKK